MDDLAGLLESDRSGEEVAGPLTEGGVRTLLEAGVAPLDLGHPVLDSRDPELAEGEGSHPDEDHDHPGDDE